MVSASALPLDGKQVATASLQSTCDSGPSAATEMSSFLKSVLPSDDPPALPPLREKEVYDAYFKVSPNYDLRSAYFLSQPGTSEDMQGGSEYSRLVYSTPMAKRSDQTIFGGIIGGLAGLFGLLLSKKVIATAVLFAVLLSMGLTGTSPHEAVSNLVQDMARNH